MLQFGLKNKGNQQMKCDNCYRIRPLASTKYGAICYECFNDIQQYNKELSQKEDRKNEQTRL